MILLLSCNKNEEPKPVVEQNPGYLLSTECKAWTMFQPGSYWVYFNETKQALDCTSYKHGLYYNKENYTDGIHECNWFFVNSNIFIKFSLAGGKNGNILTVVLPHWPNLIALTQKSLEDSVEHDTVPDIYTYTLVEKLSSVTLNGNTFTNVIHTKCSYNNMDRFVYDFYWVRNVGIVYFKKRNDYQDTIWTLTHWQVYQ